MSDYFVTLWKVRKGWVSQELPEMVFFRSKAIMPSDFTLDQFTFFCTALKLPFKTFFVLHDAWRADSFHGKGEKRFLSPPPTTDFSQKNDPHDAHNRVVA